MTKKYAFYAASKKRKIELNATKSLAGAQEKLFRFKNSEGDSCVKESDVLNANALQYEASRSTCEFLKRAKVESKETQREKELKKGEKIQKRIFGF